MRKEIQTGDLLLFRNTRLKNTFDAIVEQKGK